MDDDDQVSAFISITSADERRARYYLVLADYDLSQAIQLFFDSPSLDNGDVTEVETGLSNYTPQTSINRTRGANYTDTDDGVIHIESDDDIPEEAPSRKKASNKAPYVTQLEDEAMARRLQEEMYADDITALRKPMARTTETLVGPGSSWMSDSGAEAAILDQINSRWRRRDAPNCRAGIFNQDPHVSWEDSGNSDIRRMNLSQATAGASDLSAKSNLLAEMYRPPFELITRLSWEEARDKGKSTEKWLLVNVQDPAIFDCQVLNRDIWKDAHIKDTIKENFLFMQYSKDNPEGRNYIQYYFPAHDSQESYPHIAVVDPRTGEQVKVWSGPPVPTALDFLSQLHEFLERYSLKASARNPVSTGKRDHKVVDVDRMTDKEMLQMALENSLISSGSLQHEDPDSFTRDTVVQPDKGKGRASAIPTITDSVDNREVEAEKTTNGSGASSHFASISSTKPHIEPSNDSTTNRIQFRYSGGVQIRRFVCTDLVRRIFEWLKAEPLEGKEGQEFELIFMGKNLSEVLDKSISDVGLRNGSVMVEFKE